MKAKRTVNSNYKMKDEISCETCQCRGDDSGESVEVDVCLSCALEHANGETCKLCTWHRNLPCQECVAFSLHQPITLNFTQESTDIAADGGGT